MTVIAPPLKTVDVAQSKPAATALGAGVMSGIELFAPQAVDLVIDVDGDRVTILSVRVGLGGLSYRISLDRAQLGTLIEELIEASELLDATAGALASDVLPGEGRP